VVEIANTTNGLNVIDFSWYDQNGTEVSSGQKTLSAYAQEHIIVSDTLSLNETGTLIINSSAPVIAGAAEYYFDPSTAEITSGCYTEASEAFGSTMSGTYNTYLSMTNWLRVTNLSATSQHITVDYGDASGTLTLPAHSRHDALIPDDSLIVDQNGQYGSFTLNSTASGVISGSVVRTRSLEEKLDFISVSPVR